MFLATRWMSNRGKPEQKDFVIFYALSLGECKGRCVVSRILMSGLVCVPAQVVMRGTFKQQQRSWVDCLHRTSLTTVVWQAQRSPGATQKSAVGAQHLCP